jgi:hypothetical protein
MTDQSNYYDDKYRGLHGLSYTPGPRQAKAEPSLVVHHDMMRDPANWVGKIGWEFDRLATQRAVIAGHKSTEGPSQFGRATITGQPAALSRPQSMVREALRMGGCPHRALAQIADDDLAVARQLLADAMEGRRE